MSNEAKKQAQQRQHDRVEVAIHCLDDGEFLVVVDLPSSAEPFSPARRGWIERVLAPDVSHVFVGPRTIRAVFDPHVPTYARPTDGYVLKIAGVGE